jgi:hypothetical protein
MMVSTGGARRSARVRTLIVWMALTVLGPATSHAQTLPSSYSVQHIGGHGYMINNTPVRINSLGQFATMIDAANPDPVLGEGLWVFTDSVGWENLAPVHTMSECASPSAHAVDINDAGHIVGNLYCSLPGGAVQVGFVFNGETYEYINPPAGGFDIYLTGLNNDGTAVGWGAANSGLLPVVVPAGEPAQFIQSPIFVDGGRATAISDEGHVVGFYNDSSHPLGGALFVYHNGSVTALPVSGIPFDINNNGDVVGYSTDFTTWTETPLLYRNGSVIQPQLPAGTNHAEFWSINDAGIAVGLALTDTALRPLIYSEQAGVLYLDELVDNPLGFTLEYALSINNAGHILVNGYVDGVSTNFLLTPSSTCDTGGSSLMRGGASLLTEAPKLEITPCGPTTFHITVAPAMDDVVMQVAVKNVLPDPTASLSFDWRARFSYTTRQKYPKTVRRTFDASAVGPDSPAPSTTFFVAGTPLTATRAGGNMTVTVSTSLPGPVPLTTKRTDMRVRGTNPAKADVQAAIVGNEAIKTLWLKKMACKESKQRQFATTTESNFYAYIDEPLMNRNGDGGMGIMQITNNDTTKLPNDARSDVLWDWRKNVEAGIALFQGEKWTVAQGYPARVRTATVSENTLAKTNSHRAFLGEPPLAAVHIRDFVRSGGPNGDEVLEDAVRAYNGYLGHDQFGNVLHEFRIRTKEITGLGFVFHPTNERVEGGVLVADAVWERVPAVDRPSGGNRNYVEDVRNTDPTCPQE